MTKMNYIDLVKHYFPDASNEQADYILWEHTGFPCFFTLNKHCPTELSRLRKQLRQFKYKMRKRNRGIAETIAKGNSLPE